MVTSEMLSLLERRLELVEQEQRELKDEINKIKAEVMLYIGRMDDRFNHLEQKVTLTAEATTERITGQINLQSQSINTVIKLIWVVGTAAIGGFGGLFFELFNNN